MKWSVWLYKPVEPEYAWTVGFYTNEGEWVSETEHESADSAARRVHWLNGGNGQGPNDQVAGSLQILDGSSEPSQCNGETT